MQKRLVKLKSKRALIKTSLLNDIIQGVSEIHVHIKSEKFV